MGYGKRNSLKVRILLPLAVAFSVFTVFIVMGGHHQFRSALNDAAAQKMKTVEQYYAQALSLRTKKLIMGVAAVKQNAELLEAWSRNDKGLLLAGSKPLFEAFRELNITHFYYHRKDQVNLLRVHQPDRFGDRIARVTMQQAVRHKAVASGAELGPMGTFTLRLVAPVHYRGQLLGYLELGEEIEDVIDQIKELFGVDSWLLINKRHLSFEGWVSGQKMLGRDFDWNMLADFAVTAATAEQMPGVLRAHLAKGLFGPDAQNTKLVGNDRTWNVATVPAVSAEGRQVGYFITLSDVTDVVQSNHWSLKLAGVISGLLFGLLFVLFYLITHKTEKDLLLAHGELNSALTRSKGILDTVGDGIIGMDAWGVTTFVNAAAIRMLGWTEDEMLNNVQHRMIHHSYPDGSSYPMAACPIHDVIQRGVPAHGDDEYFWRKDGSMFPVDYVATPLLRNGEVVGTVLAFRDSTERKKTEAALEDYRERLEILVSERTATLERAEKIAHVGSWHLNLRTNELSWSDEAYRIFELPPDKPMTMEAFLGTIHADDRPMVEKAWAQAMEGSPYSIDHRIVCESGVKWVHEIAEVQFDDAGVAVAAHGAVQDVTSQKKAGDELSAALQRAESANQAKSMFLANMSHEIRTPMNGIIGMTHLVLQSQLDDGQRNFIRKAHDSAESLLGILNDILDLSKIEAGKLELDKVPFKLRDVVDGVSGILKHKAGVNGIRMQIKFSADVPFKLVGDPLRLRQVLINLVGNAVKFTGPGGCVNVTVSLREETDAEAVLWFSVEDSGIGISQEERSRLFRAFSQADSSTTRKYGGTGLGLVISSSIVNLMGGEIDVRSEPGVGSTFSFSARFTKQHDLTHAADGGVQSELDGDEVGAALAQLRGRRILLVEDNEINQELMRELLKSNGLGVEVAANGLEALQWLDKERFDAVLMDCQMPLMDGYEATRRIREQGRFRSLPIIALTASVMKGERDRALQAGMNEHIAKPISPDRFFSVMARVISAAAEAPDGGDREDL